MDYSDDINQALVKASDFTSCFLKYRGENAYEEIKALCKLNIALKALTKKYGDDVVKQATCEIIKSKNSSSKEEEQKRLRDALRSK